MRYIGLIFGLIGLTFVLSACTVRVAPPPVGISNLSFQTNIQDGSGRYIICDNVETRLVYTFDYVGYLEAWESVLVGEATGEERGRQRFTPPQPLSGPAPETMTVTYTLLPRSAPLSLANPSSIDPQKTDLQKVGPQSIIVEPVRGQGSHVELTIFSRGGYTRSFRSRVFPVIATC